MKYIIVFVSLLLLVSCRAEQTRAERMEKATEEYLLRSTHPMTDYTVVVNNTYSEDTLFLGFVSYRCMIADHYSIYRVVFVGVKGDSIVYVGGNENIAMHVLFEEY